MTDNIKQEYPLEERIDFLTSEHEIEREAAHMLIAIEYSQAREKALANPIPDNTTDTRDMIETMRQTLNAPQEIEEIKRLEQHAAILDLAFRRLMMDADLTYTNIERIDCDPMKYAAAFKAQDQYRRTVKTIKLLKKRPKPKKTRGKRT